jgi:hypothetical protein
MLHKPRAHRAQVFSAQEFHDDLLDDNGDDIDARISFHLHSRWTDATHIDPRSWVYGLHHIVGSVSGTIADGGVGKSSLVITESIAMATERNLLGVQPNGRQRVLYWNGEEPLDEIERRVHAACQQYKIDPELLTDWLFVMSGLDHPITVATVGRNGVSFDDVIINTLSETRRRLRRRPSLPSWSIGRSRVSPHC